MPLFVWALIGLVGWRATDVAAEQVGKVVPYVVGGVALYLLIQKGR